MKIIKALLLVLGVLVLAAGGLVGYLTLTEYRPDDIEQLEVTQAARSDNVRVGERLDVLSFNTGYCGLGRDQDFFMDGGTMVRPESEQIVRDNMNGILSELARRMRISTFSRRWTSIPTAAIMSIRPIPTAMACH